MIGTESRTSSPIRIPRNKETYMHDEVLGLFPCGEGAGYAGALFRRLWMVKMWRKRWRELDKGLGN